MCLLPTRPSHHSPLYGTVTVLESLLLGLQAHGLRASIFYEIAFHFPSQLRAFTSHRVVLCTSIFNLVKVLFFHLTNVQFINNTSNICSNSFHRFLFVFIFKWTPIGKDVTVCLSIPCIQTLKHACGQAEEAPVLSKVLEVVMSDSSFPLQSTLLQRPLVLPSLLTYDLYFGNLCKVKSDFPSLVVFLYGFL